VFSGPIPTTFGVYALGLTGSDFVTERPFAFEHLDAVGFGQLSVMPVPEPSSAVLVLTALLGIACVARRRLAARQLL
jgi:hypothetical protein